MKLRATCLLALLGAFSSAPSAALDYIPFAGMQGYQEIRVDDDVWFVAFHGDADAEVEALEAAWRVRAAQLCGAGSARWFVRLRFLFERVVADDPALLSANRPRFMRASGGLIFVPIYTGPNPGARADAPSVQGHVRCLESDVGALELDRLVPVDSTLDDGRKRGWLKAPS